MTILVRMLIGGVLGAAFGFAMYRFVGCRTGACPLTGNPFIAVALYGGLGALLAAGK